MLTKPDDQDECPILIWNWHCLFYWHQRQNLLQDHFSFKSKHTQDTVVQELYSCVTLRSLSHRSEFNLRVFNNYGINTTIYNTTYP